MVEMMMIRLTKSQKERIQNKAEAEGYPRGRYSTWVRQRILAEEISNQVLLRKIYEKVVEK